MLAQISEILSTLVASLPIRYLGISLTAGRMRSAEWQPVTAKIDVRLEGWHARLLSRGGRLVLLQSVLTAIPTYFMAIARMPEGVRRQIERTMRRFFWQGARTSETRGVALVAWSTITRPKSLGGLGIRHLKHMNLALLTKWVGRIMGQSEDLVIALLRDCYGATVGWTDWSTPRRGDSAFISGLRPLFSSMQHLFRPRLGDGAKFRFWEDDWAGIGRLQDLYPRLHALAIDLDVSVKSVFEAGWFPTLPNSILDQRFEDLAALQLAVSHFHLTVETADTWVWHGASFSARKVYHHLQELEGSSDTTMFLKCCRIIWKRRIPLKIKLFSWLLLRQRLMTRSFHQRFCLGSSAECPLCGGVSEDCSHLFFECTFAQASWRAASTSSLDVSTAESFWSSIARGPFRCAAEWNTIFANL